MYISNKHIIINFNLIKLLPALMYRQTIATGVRFYSITFIYAELYKPVYLFTLSACFFNC